MDKTYKNYQKKELNLKISKTAVFRHENIHPESYDFEDLPNYLSKYKSEPLLVELFCGAGGLSIGLMEEGFRPALSVDNNSNSLETHKAYFPGAAVNQDLGIFDVVDYFDDDCSDGFCHDDNESNHLHKSVFPYPLASIVHQSLIQPP